MEKMFVGVDVSKESFDVALVDHLGNLINKGLVFRNSSPGIKDFVTWLSELNRDVWVCMEHTGHYGYLLHSILSKEKVSYSVVNPLEIKLSAGITRGKTDAADAILIAKYAQTNHLKLERHDLSDQVLSKLKILMKTRDLLVKQRVQLVNHLKALEIANKSIGINDLLKQQRSLVTLIDRRITKIEKQMMELIKSEEPLEKSYSKITKVIGVGPITAVKCIVETKNFSSFDSARKFSCHCGLAPFKYESGVSVKGRTKTSKYRNRELKSVLFKAAGSAIQHDPQIKAYYERKTKNGKHKLSVLNAVANKLVLRIFAVAKREEPFVKLAA